MAPSLPASFCSWERLRWNPRQTQRYTFVAPPPLHPTSRFSSIPQTLESQGGPLLSHHHTGGFDVARCCPLPITSLSQTVQCRTAVTRCDCKMNEKRLPLGCPPSLARGSDRFVGLCCSSSTLPLGVQCRFQTMSMVVLRTFASLREPDNGGNVSRRLGAPLSDR